MNIDYTEKIKQLVKNIDFNETTKMLFYEFLDFEYASLDELYDIVNNSMNKKFYDIDYKDIKNISTYTSNIYFNEEKTSKKYLWERQDEHGIMIDVLCINNKELGFENQAIIPNPYNYAKQFLNLLYVLGLNLEEEYSDKSKVFIEIKLNNKKTYYVERTNYSSLIMRYINCNLYIYNYKILLTEANTPRNYKEIFFNAYSKKYKQGEELINLLKNHINNVDFIFAILMYVNDESKLKLYIECIKENESYSNHMPMDDLYQLISTAFWLKEGECPTNIRFNKYYKKKLFQQDAGKELYDELSQIYKYEYEIMNVFFLLHPQKNLREMLNFIKSGLRDREKILSKADEISDLNKIENQ